MNIAENYTLTNSQKTQLLAHLRKDIRVIELFKNLKVKGELNLLERIMLKQIAQESARELGFIA